MGNWTESIFFLVFIGMLLFFVAVYVDKRKRSGLPLWRAIAVFCGFFLGIAVPLASLFYWLIHLIGVDPHYTRALSLFLLFGVLGPSWAFALGKIAIPQGKTIPPQDVVIPEPIPSTGGTIRSFFSRIREGFSKNKWQSWGAFSAMLIMIGTVVGAIFQGYDMTPLIFLLLFLLGFWAIMGVFVSGVRFVFTRTDFGIGVAARVDRCFEWLTTVAAILAIGGSLIWLVVSFFGSMPWWASVIIVLLLLK
jgi:hypothetical protein